MAHLLEDKTREELLDLCKRWERAHCNVGICGSEYYADPERVFERVRDQRHSAHEALIAAVIGRKKVEEELRGLQGVSDAETVERQWNALDCAISYVSDLHGGSGLGDDCEENVELCGCNFGTTVRALKAMQMSMLGPLKLGTKS